MMRIEFEKGGTHWQANLEEYFDCSSTFGDPKRESSAWHAGSVKIEPVVMGDWVGSVDEGASVNFFQVQLNPHGNGTHTECYGHIDKGHQKLNDYLKKNHFLAYFHRQGLRRVGTDQLLLKSDLPVLDWSTIEVFAIEAKGVLFPQNFSGQNPPYFEPELCAFLAEQGVKHLICNLPSLDREEDGGALQAHKAFWQYPDNTRKESTITELAVYPEKMREGFYYLNLQTAPLHNDAVPSRPIFYPAKRL